MTVDETIAVNGDTSQGRRNSLFNENTIARVVVDLDARQARIWLRREPKAGWITYPLDFMPA